MARRKLLLADDSVTIQKVVNLTFADEGIDVVTVGDGDSAMQKIVENLPDLVLADVNMPGLTGYQICEILRENEATRHVPVILLVGSFEPFDEAEAARVGATAHLTKPFQSIRQLVAQVSELIESAEKSNGAEPQADHHGEEASESLDQAAAIESTDIGSEDAPAEPIAVTAEEPEAEDIENLYEQSIALKGDDSSDLADIGIDDDMIETSYTTEDTNSDFVNFEIERRQDVPAPDDSNANMHESYEAEAQDEAASFHSDDYGDLQNEDVSKFESTISYTNWQPADMREEQPADEMVDQSAAEGNGVNPPASFAETLPEPARIGDDTIRMENRFDTSGSGAFHFDEIDLLDLSQTGEAKTIEITTPLNAIEQGSNQQVVSLAPELIEMIAQRVVEKLSEKY